MRGGMEGELLIIERDKVAWGGGVGSVQFSRGSGGTGGVCKHVVRGKGPF